MWNYIYFVLYLDSINTNDHNALEKYVYERTVKDLANSNSQKYEIGFFPLRRAKMLPESQIISVPECTV